MYEYMTNLSSTMPSVASLGTRLTQHLLAVSNTITPTICHTLWQDIVMRYSEEARAYHTLNHLQQLFAQFDHIQHYLQQPHIVALALYYHDAIYNPKGADNELKSAEYALDKLSGYLSIEQCERIYTLIMMTATHELEDMTDLDGAYLLDMDLSILGAAWQEYEHYAQAVRREYAHVATDDYRRGRIAVLKGLLAHPKLYLTDDYYHRLEQQARLNIKREIEFLLKTHK